MKWTRVKVENILPNTIDKIDEMVNTRYQYFVIAFHKNYNYYPMGKGIKMEGGEFFSPSFPALFPSYNN
jgi:hypothetical protein